MGEARMSETGRSGGSQALEILYRHRSALIWIAVLVLIAWMQWPMIKGTLYRFEKAPADGMAWRTDFQAALAESKQTGKPVLLDFSASWCPPCQVMKHDIWPDEKVRQAIETSYIPVLLDVDAAASQEVAQRYNVRSVPTILVVDKDGRVVRQEGFMSRNKTLAFLKPSA